MKHQKHQFREHLCNSSHCSLICSYLVGPKSQSQVSLAVLTYKYFYTVFQCQDGDIYFQDVVIDKYFDPSIPKIFFSSLPWRTLHAASKADDFASYHRKVCQKKL